MKSTKVNVTIPAVNPVTWPDALTIAMLLLLLIHKPPEVGDSCVFPPSHIRLAPTMDAVGFELTTTLSVGSDTQFVLLFTKTNDAEPCETAETNPKLLTVATAELLLVHVPPVDGLN